MTISLATALGLAAVALMFTVGLPAYRRAAAWFALAAIGQGAMLAMIDAGPFPGYQHYATLPALSTRAPWLLALIGVQTLIVGAGWWRAGVITTLRQSGIPVWRLTLALALSVATAATVSADARRYVAELAFAIVLQLLAAATIVLGARAWPVSAMRRLESGVSRLLGSDEPAAADRPFAWTVAILATVLAGALNVLAYERHPHVPDEVVYLHHAKYLAEGRLEMPALAVPAAFDVDLMEYEPTRWFSPVPPGWPAVLAVGAWAGVPWLVNPVLAGLNILLAFSLLSRLYSRRVARVASVLLACSPWFLFLGMSYMTHQLTLSAVLLAAVGVVRARESGAWGWGLLAGIGVGVTSLIRPLDGVIIGALIGAWALGAGGTRLRFAPLSGLVIGTALIGALVLPYNRMLTGDPLRFPINAYNDKHHAVNSNAYWFGPDRGMGWPTDPNPGHSPVDGLINANLNTFGINTDLFGWFTGSLIFVTWLVCSGTWRRQDSLMMAVILAFALVYFPYYFSGGPDFGARYWFPVIVPLVALSVRGIQAFERRTDARVWLAVGALLLMTLVTYVPWRSVDKYHHYRGMRADIRALAVEHGFGADLVLVRGNRFPDYASAFAHNPADLSSPVTIYAWDRDPQTRVQVLREYADRRVWLLDGPSVTGGGYRIAAGPIEARALLAGAPR